MKRRSLIKAAGAAAVTQAAAGAGWVRPAVAQATPSTAPAAAPAPAIVVPDAARTLRVIPQANLTSLDPVWTTAVVTRNHGYLVYDQLVAVDADNHPQPQMADGWTTEDNDRTWTFTLREKLVFHDGTPVLARDCVASIRRWQARDSLGQTLAAVTDALDAPDDRTIRFRLKRPFPLMLYTLGKPSPLPLFIMPERLAATDPFKAITDPIGSGPFQFVKNEWDPGSRAAWAKFPGYVPRTEFPDGIAGGRKANVDRVVWTVIPDAATAAAAMVSGEHDYWEYPLHDLLPVLRKSPDVVVAQRLTEATYAGMRINHLQPPFDNEKVRQALLMGIDQRDYMHAVVGEDESGKGWAACETIYKCGGPFESAEGNDALRQHSVAKATEALKESGYKGERTVVLAPSDYPQINALSLVTADLMKRIGFNVDLVATDWGTLTQRRASKEPVAKGGWSVFHSTWSASDVQNPAVHQQLRANGAGAWFGWPSDPKIELLRDEWINATDIASRKKIAASLQAEAFVSVPFIPLGYYWQPSAWRKNITGTFSCPVTTFWNIGKST